MNEGRTTAWPRVKRIEAIGEGGEREGGENKRRRTGTGNTAVLPAGSCLAEPGAHTGPCVDLSFHHHPGRCSASGTAGT